MSISSICEHVINEINFNRLRTKQKSIGKLFPPFKQRVKAVAANGGVQMREMMPEFWHFTVTSGTKEGVKYDVYVEFSNIYEMIKKYAGNKKLWKKDQSGPNYMLLAAEILNSVDMKFSCSCPADLYWGGAYIKTQRDAQFGRQENRPPNIRNPRQYGAYCKHIDLMASVLPNYTSTFASFLKKYWSDEVDNAVELFKQQKAAFGAVGQELGKMAAEPSPGRAGRFDRGDEDMPPEMPPEDEEPPTPPDDEPPPNVGPQSATKAGTTLPAKGTSPALKRTGIEDEEHPRIKDKNRKGKYTPNESVREDKGFRDRLGQCYILSGRFVMEHPEWELVHGTIQKPGGSTPRIGHAWAEKVEKAQRYEIRVVYDPVLDQELPWDAYERFTGAKEVKRYTSDQMVSILIKDKTWGPWNE